MFQLCTLSLALIATALATNVSAQHNIYNAHDSPDASADRSRYTNANIFLDKEGNDPRRRLNDQEKVDFSGVGFFHHSNAQGKFVGSGFAAENRRVIVTAAHNFSEHGSWQRHMRNSEGLLNIQGAQFYSDVCQRSYPLRSIEVGTMSGVAEADYGIVVLAEPLCVNAKPLPLKALTPQLMESLFERTKTNPNAYLRLSAFQWLERSSDDPRNTGRSTGPDSPAKKRGFAKLTDAGGFTQYNRERQELAEFTASSLPGASGGPITARFRAGSNSSANVIYAIGIAIAESDDGTVNVARIIDDKLYEKIQAVVRKNP